MKFIGRRKWIIQAKVYLIKHACMYYVKHNYFAVIFWCVLPIPSVCNVLYQNNLNH